MSKAADQTELTETAPSRSYWVLRGVRDALGIPSLVLGASMIAVGGLAHDVGYPFGAAVMSTFLIWAAPAQVIMFGLIAGGATVPVIALAVGFSSVRFLPMCISILPLLRTRQTGTPTLLIAAHYVAVTNWVEGMRRLPPLPQAVRLPYFFGFANTVMVSAATATGIGFYLVGQLPALLAAGLLFVSPIYFTSALARAAREKADAYAMLLGFLLTPIAILLAPAGFDLIGVGIVGGTIAYCAGRWHRARSAMHKPASSSINPPLDDEGAEL